jgi:hypothetical protein
MPREKKLLYPKNRRKGGPQSQSGCDGDEINSLSLYTINETKSFFLNN